MFKRKLTSKEVIEKEMSDKYGENWLDQCIDGLRDKDVRRDLNKILQL